jgi:NAD(P)-dependent dehydrogenase (short-subunit alcohol dehydrogenase family)
MQAFIQGASRGLGLALVDELLKLPELRGVVATSRHATSSAELRTRGELHPDRLTVLDVDVTDEATIAAAAERVGDRFDRLHLLMNVAGLLHEGDAMQPEKKIEQADPESFARAFAVHATGPMLVVKHLLPFLRHDERAVIANLSARVGSIADNRLGGWYAYRASKAAQNMITKGLSIELGRRAKNVLCVGLHPGTVDTELSEPFQRNVPEHQLFSPQRAARQLLEVVDGLTPDSHGRVLDYAGKRIPW